MKSRKPLDGLFATAQLSELADAAAPLAKNIRQIAELSSTSVRQLQTIAEASRPHITEMASIAAATVSRMAELQQVSAQLGRQLSESHRAIAPSVVEIGRWVEISSARFKEAQQSLAPTLEQMRQMAEVIRPQIIQLAQARELFDVRAPSGAALASMLRITVPNIATAGTFPQVLSVAVGLAGSAVGLQPHEMLGLVAAEARLATANDDQPRAIPSLVNEAVAVLEASKTNGGDIAFASEFLDQFITAAQSYLSKAETVPALKGLLQVITMMIAVLGLLYASQSATTSDVDKATSAVNELTAIQRQRLAQSDQLFRDKMDELIAATEDRTARQIASLVPLPLYRAGRSIPVRSSNNMKSAPVGWIRIGDLVSLKTRERKWVEIDYFDHSLGTRVSGWVVKKYLKRIN